MNVHAGKITHFSVNFLNGIILINFIENSLKTTNVWIKLLNPPPFG
jgi:hypothetical protein